MKLDQIVIICYEAIKVYGEQLAGSKNPDWEQAPAWIKEDFIASIKFLSNNTECPAYRLHEHWLGLKLLDGWTYGKETNYDKKHHNFCLNWDQLKDEQKMLWFLFKQIAGLLF